MSCITPHRNARERVWGDYMKAFFYPVFSKMVMKNLANDPAALLKADQVAVRLGCSLRLVRQLSADRRIPFVKVGRLTRFKPSDVESYVERNTVRGIR